MKIAVVGSGISGLACSLLLSQKHEVHLFESEKRLGGHAHTSSIYNNSKDFNVDTGFLVYNELTYPHLTAMFKYLNVETVASDMSLSIQEPNVDLEWAGDNLDSVFAQRKNLFNPRFYKLMFDILKFHKHAEKNRDLAREHKWTVAQLLKNLKYSNELTEWYVLPMIAAIWSTPEKSMLDFPAETFLTFFINHKLLQVNDRPQWRTVKNGSVNYVNKIAAQLQSIHLDEAVVSVQKNENGLELTSNKSLYQFDKVVFAVNPSVSSKMYRAVNADTNEILSSFKTESNQAYLHLDKSFMPKSKKCWASWNVKANLKNSNSNSNKVALTYFLNRLQPLPTPDNILLTLNPNTKPNDIILQHEYHHPIFNQKAIEAQKQLPEIQGQDGVYHIGAWTRYGFHEDGLLSAVKLAELFDIQTPWGV
jgi:predicted NAD/FAD-binding protein